MKSALLIASIAMLAGAASAPALAGAPHGAAAHPQHQERYHDRAGHGMQAVATAAEPGAPGDGWRYYTDPQAHRAVVISPQGEYYLSRGKGLRLVALTQAGE